MKHITCCENLDGTDMSRRLKMVELWQLCCPQPDTVERGMPSVNIYLTCECVSVCGTAWWQELLWGFICSMTRQPVIYEHLELLFKHNLISHQTFPEARAEQEWPRPNQTRPHTVSPSIPPDSTVECWTLHKLGTVHQSAYVCLQEVFYEYGLDSWEQHSDITVTEIICSEFFFRPANRARG